ncbi:MAG: thiamine-phosphate kinase [Deltaproteobacteria bacterium]|nr:thiamine-phosphate kinase [Deltaproteobacteria bacterium]
MIETIRKATPNGQGVLLGIGDDAAWVRCSSNSTLITSDLLIEGVHFDLQWASFFTLGYKSLAVNLSDVAAMGGRPSYMVVSLGIPAGFSTEHIQEFYRGLQSLASETGVGLVGGDTSASKRFFISVCLLGHARYGAIPRSGGKTDDDLYVTGTLGDSALGLELLKTGRGKEKRRHRAYLISRHNCPTARLKAGEILAKERLAKAMIDVSDGLLQDLGHICKASGIGAVVWQEQVPLSPACRSIAAQKGFLYALTGGEDYELLFSSRPRDRRRLERIQGQLGVPVTRIGKCQPSREGIKVIGPNGKPTDIAAKGYDHFKNRL